MNIKKWAWLLAVPYVMQISTNSAPPIPIITCQGTFEECKEIYDAILKDTPQELYWKQANPEKQINRPDPFPGNKGACGQDDCGKDPE